MYQDSLPAVILQLRGCKNYELCPWRELPRPNTASQLSKICIGPVKNYGSVGIENTVYCVGRGQSFYLLASSSSFQIEDRMK
jgi:hypothetical protein